MSPEFIAGIVLVVVAFLLVLCDRMVKTEGFTNWDTNVPSGMCGVDLAPCPFGTSCVNGYCAKTDPPTLPYFSDLPVLPKGYSK
jgi:hypothetical protein